MTENMSKPRRHHYLSQFYLAGFTSNGNKNGDLYCYDLKKMKVRKSKVKEEGHEKYFNRIESDNLSEDYLENELSKFESDAVEVIRNIIINKSLPSAPKDWGTLLYYLALLGVRNPVIRKTLDEAKTNISKIMLEFYLSDNKSWENLKSKLDDEKFKRNKKTFNY